MRVEGVSTIAGLDAEALPPEGLSVNVDSGELSYCVDGQGATIRLTVDDALTVRTTYDAVKGPRLFIGQRILRGEELIAEAQVHAACIDAAGRARRPPAGLTDAIAPYLAP